MDQDKDNSPGPSSSRRTSDLHIKSSSSNEDAEFTNFTFSRPIAFNMPSGSSKKSSKGSKPTRSSIRELIRSLSTHRVNTLTELCRIERLAASCEDEEDARAFQEPMTAAWVHYVTSNQFLLELRGLTRSYPLCGDIVTEAHARVVADPSSNRSWNLAWLCLTKIRDDGLIAEFAGAEAVKPEMWGRQQPSDDQIRELQGHFEQEWTYAVDTMLRHWTFAPTWY